MSLFFRQRALGDTPDNLVPLRTDDTRPGKVSADQAMRHSAVWACVRLRADLISSLPIVNFRVRDGIQVGVDIPPVLRRPGALTVGGTVVTANEWVYATQADLDKSGNCFGRIIDFDANMRPSRIDLVSASSVTVSSRDGKITYRFGGKSYDPGEIWHERQYTMAGLPVGLSPVAYAAYAMGGYFSAQQFAQQWFAGGVAPAGHLKNTAKTLKNREADAVKTRFKSTIAAGDVFVSGMDWDYSVLGSDSKQDEFINSSQFSITDVARFFGVPGDLIDAEGATSKITYANITQRNLQLLVLHLGPAIQRREAAFQGLTPGPQVVQLQREALLAMDPLTRAEWIAARITSRTLAVDEGRQMDNLPPLTDDQMLQFAKLFNRQWRFTDKGSTGDLAEDISIEEELL